MVTVRKDHPILEDGSVDIDSWMSQFADKIDDATRVPLRMACELARQAESKCGRSSYWGPQASTFRAGLEMVEILAGFRADQDSLVAAALYRTVREDQLPISRVVDMFGRKVASLIEGVIRMGEVSKNLSADATAEVLGSSENQLESLRKMLVSIIDDVRVVLIKLAERACAIKEAKHQDGARKEAVALEVQSVYAPLAHRLGIGHIKWELEDLSFRYLYPVEYKRIAKWLDEKRLDRQQYIQDVIELLDSRLKGIKIEADLMGRAKHIYSIWRKMKRKNIGFDEVYDVRAVRILVEEDMQCYGVLGVVHNLWKPIPQEFDDYISNPKPNGYQSLHTAVVGPQGRALEIQIRTNTMHEDAELGVCAHWKYKGTDLSSNSTSYEEKLQWLRTILDFHEVQGDLESLTEQVKSDIEQDRIYVFTPDGHVVDLPTGATAVDFAYRVHTEIGNRCRGAKVNGKIISLVTHLKTGDKVQILTSKEGGPSRDWLHPTLGYVQTNRARAKIQSWFRKEDREKNLEAGHQILDKQLKRLGFDESKFDFGKIAARFNFSNAEEVYVALGAGDILLARVLRVIDDLYNLNGEPEEAKPIRVRKSRHKSSDNDIQIRGVGKLLTQMAKCCSPIPGDDIVGYITQGRGVSVHRQDCINVAQLTLDEPERIVEVNWGEELDNLYPVNIQVQAYDRTGLLSDITAMLANERVNLLSMNTLSTKESNTASIRFTIEVGELGTLSKLLHRINQLPNVLNVFREKDF
ncbi:GTP diphosphokinase [Marinomonas mediterranea]|jgi:(p)ppGpp synthetase, RelA/SpoT family|uniref:GTP pyrophosphokinase n=1 Tax=Marinomonas mediterranea (strain ATCC 700492 / JCM 21426 / NBRC 103028 / MMB-1) TaxID=717774 RepID=F2JTX6_MARM1|nr:GTP diphosphokinase [Marinomonas mediterranea]ADZ90397.1 (p)ppGpp synthetase I, SpoT/RelA [Marinomonas mediterranea MMB-1]WCN12506.1 GTP diphosphokinase [Marinomonas mediterranea]WCN16578.1 GTP diphosphokinase [Marinomonas mediterranea MMB-1]